MTLPSRRWSCSTYRVAKRKLGNGALSGDQPKYFPDYSRQVLGLYRKRPGEIGVGSRRDVGAGALLIQRL